MSKLAFPLAPPFAASRLRARLRSQPLRTHRRPRRHSPQTRSGQPHTQPSAQSVPGHPSTRQRYGVRNEVPLDRTSRHQPPKNPRADKSSGPVIRCAHRPNPTHPPKAKPILRIHQKSCKSCESCPKPSHPLGPPSRLRGFARDSGPKSYAPTEGPTGVCPQKSGQDHPQPPRAIGSRTSAHAPALWSAE